MTCYLPLPGCGHRTSTSSCLQQTLQSMNSVMCREPLTASESPKEEEKKKVKPRQGRGVVLIPEFSAEYRKSRSQWLCTFNRSLLISLLILVDRWSWASCYFKFSPLFVKSCVFLNMGCSGSFLPLFHPQRVGTAFVMGPFIVYLIPAVCREKKKLGSQCSHWAA